MGEFRDREDDFELKFDSSTYLGMKQGVWPPVFHFLSLYGIYVFKFYKNHRWVYVMVDDLLPCNKDYDLLFARSDEPLEFWVSLVEKAYAKLHHNYFNLNEGDIG